MRALPASVALLAALAMTAGCTSAQDSPGTPETGDDPTAQISSPTEPSDTPTPSESPSAMALVDRLMPTGEVPGLNAQWKWQDGDTGQPTTDPFGICSKTDLLSIGASDVVARTYFPPDDSDDNAAEQVAEFPDANTAARVWAVLKSWHDGCTKTAADHAQLKVGALISVPVGAGTGRWYLLSWQEPGEETGRFEAVGMVLDGTRIALLRMDSSSRHYDYPAGKEPMAGMVAGAAGWLD